MEAFGINVARSLKWRRKVERSAAGRPIDAPADWTKKGMRLPAAAVMLRFHFGAEPLLTYIAYSRSVGISRVRNVIDAFARRAVVVFNSARIQPRAKPAASRLVAFRETEQRESDGYGGEGGYRDAWHSSTQSQKHECHWRKLLTLYAVSVPRCLIANMGVRRYRRAKLGPDAT
jgi:hypothetical protein